MYVCVHVSVCFCVCGSNRPEDYMKDVNVWGNVACVLKYYDFFCFYMFNTENKLRPLCSRLKKCIYNFRIFLQVKFVNLTQIPYKGLVHILCTFSHATNSSICQRGVSVTHFKHTPLTDQCYFHCGLWSGPVGWAEWTQGLQGNCGHQPVTARDTFCDNDTWCEASTCHLWLQHEASWHGHLSLCHSCLCPLEGRYKQVIAVSQQHWLVYYSQPWGFTPTPYTYAYSQCQHTVLFRGQI